MPVAIQCHDLRKTYDGKVEAVRGLNLEIETGECFGLLGPNGAGKTTTIEILEGLLEPTSGRVLVSGKSTLDWDPIRLRRQIGYVIQDVGLFPHFNVERNVGLVPALESWPAAEIAKEVSESVVPNKEEVSPEDLPPLEYAELQKASSRRRRRRHSSGSSNATVTPLPSAGKAATPEAPVAPTTPTPAPSVAVPRTPAPTQSVPPASQYTITSGYTVNQMNQSRDGSNPFMGPDPSPARGTTGAQNVRSIRTDVQRTPAYPVRTTEATSASVHQLANVVSQAIQTQTDRMIAELRRANQSPTNVSVSMPPFPSTERVGVFVDVANLLYSARTIRMTVDFGKLLDFLRGNRRLVRAHAYCPTSPQVGDEQMFLQAVKGLGYRITTKNYKTFSSGAKKADLDLDLCMDVVRLVEGKAVDCVVLVSGDSDFMPMLDYCSDHGVRVEVAAFDEAMSATLRQSCDLFINLSMLEEIRV